MIAKNEDLFANETVELGGLAAKDWPPTREALKPAWRPVVEAFFASPEGQTLELALRQRLKAGAVIYPPKPLRLLEMLEPHEVRVVILGQDPYHGPYQAEGLAFSVANGVKAPPSLVNVFKELHRDLGLAAPMPMPRRASLMPWVRQGVFLLNQTLSVEASRPASHSNLPWSDLTKNLLREICLCKTPTVFMLWGMHAQKSRDNLRRWASEGGKEILILSANHPSPLSALKGEHPFIGCGHFGLSQKWLKERKLSINWQLDTDR